MNPNHISKCSHCGGRVRPTEKTYQGEYNIYECRDCKREFLINR
jgi:DNA-directed RNA polymerase subunit RPC12/RpoP